MFDFSSLYEMRSHLHRAINSNNVDQLEQLLLRNEINLNYIDKRGQSPLHVSCSLGHGAIVKLLCERGASQNLKNKEGWFPIHLAAYHGHADIVFFLRKQNNQDIAIQDQQEEEDDDNNDEYTASEEEETDEEEDLFILNFSNNLKL